MFVGFAVTSPDIFRGDTASFQHRWPLGHRRITSIGTRAQKRKPRSLTRKKLLWQIAVLEEYIELESTNPGALPIPAGLRPRKERVKKEYVHPRFYWKEQVPLLTATDFQREFRVSREVFNFVLDAICTHPLFDTQLFRAKLAMGVDELLAMTLCRFGHAMHVNQVASKFQCGGATVVMATWLVVCAVSDRLFKSTITDKFPLTPLQREQNALQFRKMSGGIQGIIGVIDGVMVPAVGRGWYNYKGFSSLNFCGICDPEARIVWIGGGVPGNNGDSTVMRVSGLQAAEKKLFSSGAHHLIGDSGMLASTWCICIGKKVRADNTAEIAFNTQISRARHTIERAWGMGKARFLAFRGRTGLRFFGDDTVLPDGTGLNTYEKYKMAWYFAIIMHNLCIDHREKNSPKFMSELNVEMREQLRMEKRLIVETNRRRALQGLGPLRPPPVEHSHGAGSVGYRIKRYYLKLNAAHNAATGSF